MEVGFSKGWASPSTLHLRLWVSVGKKGHLQFARLDIPLEEIAGREWIATLEPSDESSPDRPLF